MLAALFQPEAEWCMGYGTWLAHFENNLPMMKTRYDSLALSAIFVDSLAAMAFIQQKRAAGIKAKLAGNKALETADAGKQLYATLRLTGFGLYNCDQIFRFGNKIHRLAATFQTNTGKNIPVVALRMIDRQTRLLMQMDAGNLLYHFPGRRIDVIVTAKDGKVYHFPADQYAKLTISPKQNAYAYTVEDISGQVQNPEDWAALLGI